MPVILICTVEDVQTYKGKNGFGANVTVSAMLEKRRKSLTFNTNNEDFAEELEAYLQKEVTIKIILSQSSFGLRFGELMEVIPS